MNFNDALDFVTARLLPDSDPCLSADEVDALMALAVTDDEDGYIPTDDEWTPTYSVRGCYRAVAEGWTLKRGKAVGRFDFTTDGQTFRRSQQLDQIEQQRRLYARKVQSSPSTLEA